MRERVLDAPLDLGVARRFLRIDDEKLRVWNSAQFQVQDHVHAGGIEVHRRAGNRNAAEWHRGRRLPGEDRLARRGAQRLLVAASNEHLGAALGELRATLET